MPSPLAAAPLWARLSRESFAPPPLAGPLSTQVAIVGGGISGLSTALHLSRAGIAACVLEARELGAGASGRNNGQVIPTLTRHDPAAILAALGPRRGDRFLRLLAGSADLLFETIDRYGIDCDSVRRGWIQPAHSPGRAKAAERRAGEWKARGAPVQILSAADIAARLGAQGAYCGGWLHESGGHINPLAFTRGLARAAAAEGASIYAGSPVTSLAPDARGWTLQTPSASVRCQTVVLATAAHSGPLWPALARTIVPVTSYQMATEPLGRLGDTILPGNEACSDTRLDLRFLRKDRDGRIVSGGALAVQTLADRRVGRHAVRRIAELFPQLAGIGVEAVWGGRIAMTPDRLPRLLRCAPGLYAWIGCNGRGLSLAVAMGAVMADLAQGASEDDLPLPLSAPEAVPLWPLVSRTARLVLPYFRWKDSREIGWRGPPRGGAATSR